MGVVTYWPTVLWAGYLFFLFLKLHFASLYQLYEKLQLFKDYSQLSLWLTVIFSGIMLFVCYWCTLYDTVIFTERKWYVGSICSYKGMPSMYSVC